MIGLDYKEPIAPEKIKGTFVGINPPLLKERETVCCGRKKTK